MVEMQKKFHKRYLKNTNYDRNYYFYSFCCGVCAACRLASVRMVEVWAQRNKSCFGENYFSYRIVCIIWSYDACMILQKEELLDEGEEVIEAVRKHWIVYVFDFLSHAVGCAIFISAAIYLASHKKLWFVAALYGDYGAMVLVFFVMLFWVSFFFVWTKNYFDVWYVTNQHIIAINQKDIFERDEAFMELTRIQDVFFEKSGVIATLLGYGHLKVQSAGTEQEFIIEDVADVEGCAHRIMELRDKAQGKSPAIVPQGV